jgi:hypothetical protein
LITDAPTFDIKEIYKEGRFGPIKLSYPSRSVSSLVYVCYGIEILNFVYPNYTSVYTFESILLSYISFSGYYAPEGIVFLRVFLLLIHFFII